MTPADARRENASQTDADGSSGSGSPPRFGRGRAGARRTSRPLLWRPVCSWSRRSSCSCSRHRRDGLGRGDRAKLPGGGGAGRHLARPL